MPFPVYQIVSDFKIELRFVQFWSVIKLADYKSHRKFLSLCFIVLYYKKYIKRIGVLIYSCEIVKTRNCVKTLRPPSVLFPHNFSFPQNLENGLYLLNIKRYEKNKKRSWHKHLTPHLSGHDVISNPRIHLHQVSSHQMTADLYTIYKLEPKATVCISDTDRMRMFYRT
jgi:hypothetical protein